MSNEVNRSAQCLGIGLLATGGMEVALQMYLNSFVNLKFSEPLEVAALYDRSGIKHNGWQKVVAIWLKVQIEESSGIVVPVSHSCIVCFKKPGESTFAETTGRSPSSDSFG